MPDARGSGSMRVYFSVVVGSELLRGARDRRSLKLVRELWQDFKKARRSIVPEPNDWFDTGVIFAKMSARYGYNSIGQSRLVHDTLIAVSSRRHGLTVVSFNVADFQRIAEFRPFSFLSAQDAGY